MKNIGHLSHLLYRNIITKKSIVFIVGFLAIISIYCAFLLNRSAVAGTPVSLSAGYATACVAKNGTAYCWGYNNFGQVGNGTAGANQSKAVAVNTAGTPLEGKYVTKVSVGSLHSCAIANARVYCWGRNDVGQLGNNNTNSYSSKPVAVDVSADSALRNKEIIDIAAADEFTCALASDSTVACWGYGRNGRLGLGSRGIAADVNDHENSPIGLASSTRNESNIILAQRSTNSSGATGGQRTGNGGANNCTKTGCTGGVDTPRAPQPNIPTKNYKNFSLPQTVFTQGALNNYLPIKLSQSGGAAMCVIAIDKSLSTSNINGTPFCWGQGMGDGTGASPRKVDACSEQNVGDPVKLYLRGSVVYNTTVSNGYNGSPIYSNIAYFDASEPVRNADGELKIQSISIDSSGQASGLAADGSVYYWGKHGLQGYLVEAAPLCTEHDIYRECVQNCDGGGGGGNNRDSNAQSCNKTGSGSPGCGGKPPEPKYGNVDHTTTYHSRATGINELGNIKAKYYRNYFAQISGNVVDGLFCGKTLNSTLVCDAHGEDERLQSGQTGSGFDKQKQCGWFGVNCTWPTAPGDLNVDTSGWLNGKSVTAISVGSSGYACVIASDSAGCWGKNSLNQLGSLTQSGSGSKVQYTAQDRFVPTPVSGF